MSIVRGTWRKPYKESSLSSFFFNLVYDNGSSELVLFVRSIRINGDARDKMFISVHFPGISVVNGRYIKCGRRVLEGILIFFFFALNISEIL